MSNEKRISDSSIARIAGNIASGFVAESGTSDPYDRIRHEVFVARTAVSLARAIAAEVERTAKEQP